MRARGKRTAMLTGLLGIALFAGAAAACKSAALEGWYIHELRVLRGQERVLAAEKLAAMRSRRAVPALIEAIRGEEGEEVASQSTGVVRRHHGTESWLEVERKRTATPLVHALWGIGEAALPDIVEALARQEGESPSGRRVRRILEELLDRGNPFVPSPRGTAARPQE